MVLSENPVIINKVANNNDLTKKALAVQVNLLV